MQKGRRWEGAGQGWVKVHARRVWALVVWPDSALPTLVYATLTSSHPLLLPPHPSNSRPPGDAVLECYASGSRNVFVLGFVPVKGENTVVLLARDTPVNHPTIKDLNLDLTQWQPIVEVRATCGSHCWHEAWLLMGS